MASKHNEIFDRRIVARNMKRGKLNRQEYEKHLAGLPDVGHKAVPLFGEDESADSAGDNANDESK